MRVFVVAVLAILIAHRMSELLVWSLAWQSVSGDARSLEACGKLPRYWRFCDFALDAGRRQPFSPLTSNLLL